MSPTEQTEISQACCSTARARYSVTRKKRQEQNARTADLKVRNSDLTKKYGSIQMEGKWHPEVSLPTRSRCWYEC